MDVDNDLGLSIDMLDVDRLREWARLIDENGSDISYWCDRYHVISKMRMMATGIEKAVRDIGELRAALDVAQAQIERMRENAGHMASSDVKEISELWQRAEAAEAKLALLCDIREAIADVEREASGAEQEQK